MKSISSPKFVSCLLCLRAIVDVETNNISLIDLLEEIQVDPAKIPTNRVVPINFTLVSLWEKDNTEDPVHGEVKINILSPKNVVLLEAMLDLGFPTERKRLRHIAKINGLKLDTGGSYTVKIAYRDKAGEFVEVGASSIEVKFIKSQILVPKKTRA